MPNRGPGEGGALVVSVLHRPYRKLSAWQASGVGGLLVLSDPQQ
jgi:hypothetical protein